MDSSSSDDEFDPSMDEMIGGVLGIFKKLSAKKSSGKSGSGDGASRSDSNDKGADKTANLLKRGLSALAGSAVHNFIPKDFHNALEPLGLPKPDKELNKQMGECSPIVNLLKHSAKLLMSRSRRELLAAANAMNELRFKEKNTKAYTELYSLNADKVLSSVLHPSLNPDSLPWSVLIGRFACCAFAIYKNDDAEVLELCAAADEGDRTGAVTTHVLHLKRPAHERPFMVLEDSVTNSMVVSIRGTKSLPDLLAGMAAHTRKFELASGTVVRVHRGIYASARYIADELLTMIRTDEDVRDCLDTVNGRVRLVGHSLGGAVASLVHEMIKLDKTWGFLDVATFTFGAPPCVDVHSARVVGDMRVVNFIHGEDIVPTTTAAQLRAIVSLLDEHCRTGATTHWKARVRGYLHGHIRLDASGSLVVRQKYLREEEQSVAAESSARIETVSWPPAKGSGKDPPETHSDSSDADADSDSSSDASPEALEFDSDSHAYTNHLLWCPGIPIHLTAEGLRRWNDWMEHLTLDTRQLTALLSAVPVLEPFAKALLPSMALKAGVNGLRHHRMRAYMDALNRLT